MEGSSIKLCGDGSCTVGWGAPMVKLRSCRGLVSILTHPRFRQHMISGATESYYPALLGRSAPSSNSFYLLGVWVMRKGSRSSFRKSCVTGDVLYWQSLRNGESELTEALGRLRLVWMLLGWSGVCVCMCMCMCTPVCVCLCAGALYDVNVHTEKKKIQPAAIWAVCPGRRRKISKMVWEL